jgi:hypothetical protein
MSLGSGKREVKTYNPTGSWIALIIKVISPTKSPILLSNFLTKRYLS